ncbi:DUF6470 family protein [Halalkalibacter nanhaiisediminis]|uniref:YviE n=1 Tax=Halalkalibacter nanhaiisediminis TaxID=688079 RepID=A0A562QT54_9BACI|nr:DUF6470 family protein [Halalkalibacter nanhaiisediminis]TWI59948.1 hypothetical protein IQ10_00371 [Halalkalibacter nanhaiisediminis]
MRLPSLDIQATDAYIGLRSTRPDMRIRQQSADLQIHQEHVGLIEISKTASKLFIDQTQAFAEANLKTPLRMASDFLKKTESHVAEYLAKTVQQGNQMMRIENGNGALAQIAKAKGERPPVQTTFANMPRSMSSVKFDYQPSEISVNAPFKEAEITVNRRAPQIEIPKWQTEAYMRQKNQISFQAVGVNVNRSL